MLHTIKNWMTVATFATVSAVLLAPQGARAQSSMGTCSDIGGFLDQSVAAGMNGTTQTATFTLQAGDEIVGEIRDASNSFLLIDPPGVTVFSGDTGTLVRSYVITVGGPVQISADIQAGPGGSATITVRCIPVPVTVLPPPTSPFPTPSPTPTPTPTDPNTPPDPNTPTTPITMMVPMQTRVDFIAAVKSAVNALDSARQNTAPSGFPGNQNADNNLLEFVIPSPAAEAQVSANVVILDLFQQMGLDATDPLRVAITTNMSAAKTGLVPNMGPFIDSLEAVMEDRGLDRFTEEMQKSLRAYEQASRDLNNEQRAENPGPTRDLNPIGPLSFSGTNDNMIRFSTRGVPLGSEGRTWLWTDGQVGYLTGSASRDGYVAGLRLGIVHAANDTLDLGAYVAYLRAQTGQITPTTNTDLETDGIGAGAYMKYALGTELYGAVSFYIEKSKNETNVSGSVGSFDRVYATLDAEISRQYETDNAIKIVPSLGVGLVSSSTEAFVDSAANFFPKDDDVFGTAFAGLDLSQTFASQLDWAKTVTLTGGAMIRYTDRPSQVFSTGQQLTDTDLTGTVRAGAKFFLNSGAAFDIRAGVTGIGGSTQSIFGGFEWRDDF